MALRAERPTEGEHADGHDCTACAHKALFGCVSILWYPEHV